MDENPYQAPATVSDAVQSEGEVRADGKYLVVRTGTVLPLYCVKTNQPVGEQELRRRRLTWCSPFVGLLILLSGLLLILVYFLLRKNCVITYALAPEVRRKHRNRRLAKIAAVVMLFFAVPIAAGSDSTPVILVVTLLFFAAVVSLFVGNSPLVVSKYQQGEFWIAGCSQDFLARFES